MSSNPSLAPIQIGNIYQSGGVVWDDDTPFRYRPPKPEGVHAVKLTKGNLHDVAKYLKTTYANQEPYGEEQAVTTTDDAILVGDIIQGDDYICGSQLTLTVGDWAVEVYDFSANRVKFRRATLDERREHDLR